jgi:hypothetical protein
MNRRKPSPCSLSIDTETASQARSQNKPPSGGNATPAQEHGGEKRMIKDDVKIIDRFEKSQSSVSKSTKNSRRKRHHNGKKEASRINSHLDISSIAKDIDVKSTNICLLISI